MPFASGQQHERCMQGRWAGVPASSASLPASLPCERLLLQGKLCQLSGLEDRLDAKLAAAASLHGQVAGLATQQAAGLDAIDTLRRDVKVWSASSQRVLRCRHGPAHATVPLAIAAIHPLNCHTSDRCCGLQRLHLQVGQLENRQVLAASEAAVAPLTAVQKTQVRVALWPAGQRSR